MSFLVSFLKSFLKSFLVSLLKSLLKSFLVSFQVRRHGFIVGVVLPSFGRLFAGVPAALDALQARRSPQNKALRSERLPSVAVCSVPVVAADRRAPAS